MANTLVGRAGVIYKNHIPIAYFYDDITQGVEKLVLSESEFISYWDFYDIDDMFSFLYTMQVQLGLDELEV
ncbi:MAG: hypothetical protein NC218_08055 [Acetobacter sp.]|nr:hypothetical protein [Acetobacter sp.]